jgi:hypothetical protein
LPVRHLEEQRASEARLDLHEGISHPDPARRGCPRWPEHFRLLSSQGELVRGRCRSTNQCSYCAKLAAVENAELLALDALAGSAPALWVVLTTADANPDPSAFYKSREVLLRALRRRWPDCEYAALVEFTTGYGPRSGGRRRPHWNLLLKGVPREDMQRVQDVVRDVWCGRENAKPKAQFVGEVGEVGGLLRYIALHFQKESQAPPPGWRGHRFLKSRGYLSTTTPEAREAARRSLRHKRELWRAIELRGLEGSAAERAATAAMDLADATSWRLLQLNPTRPLEDRERDRPQRTVDDDVQPVLVRGQVLRRDARTGGVGVAAAGLAARPAWPDDGRVPGVQQLQLEAGEPQARPERRRSRRLDAL